MPTTYYFIEAPDRPSAVLDWLRQNAPAQEYPQEKGILFHFAEAGRLGEDGTGIIDVAHSPLVSVFPSEVRRKALWTVGEVHFLAKHAQSEFPLLEAIRRRFVRWLGSHPVVFDQRRPQEGYPYYLEAGIQNVATKVFALPSGLAAIQSGQYFVADGAGDHALDVLCKSLRLRGVECV